MHFLKMKDDYLLRFDKGDDIVKLLTDFVVTEQIPAAWLSAIGAIENAELGYYDTAAKAYSWTSLNEMLEIVSLTGNVAWQDDRPVIHAHVTLGDRLLKSYSGHLKSGLAGGTVEMLLSCLPVESKLIRQFDQSTGLSLLSLPEQYAD